MQRGEPQEYLGPYFEKLPSEAIFNILYYLYIEELPAALQLNRYFSDLAEQAWQQKFHYKDHQSRGESAKKELFRFIKARASSYFKFVGSGPRASQLEKHRVNLFLACYQNRNVKQALMAYERTMMTGADINHFFTIIFLIDIYIGRFDISYFSTEVCGQLYEFLINNTGIPSFVISQAPLLDQPITLLAQYQEKGLTIDEVRRSFPTILNTANDSLYQIIRYGRINWLTVMLNENIISAQQVIDRLLQTANCQLSAYAKKEEDVYRFLVDWFFTNPSPELKSRLPLLFIEVAAKSNLAVLKALHQYQKDLEIVDEHGNTPLKTACLAKNYRNALYLLQQGAKPLDEWPWIFAPAAEQGDLDTFTGLMKFMPAEKKNEFLNVALWKATFSKRAHVVKWLLENGADPNVPDNQNQFLMFEVFERSRLLPGQKGKKLADFFNEHIGESRKINVRQETVRVNLCLSYLSAYRSRTDLSHEKRLTIFEILRDIRSELREFEKNLAQAKHPEQRNAAFFDFNQKFTDILHNPQYTSVLYTHRQEWKPILLNILIALTGIGLLLIAGKIIHTTCTEEPRAHPTFTHLLFFGKTASQHKMMAIEGEVKRLGQKLGS